MQMMQEERLEQEGATKARKGALDGPKAPLPEESVGDRAAVAGAAAAKGVPTTAAATIPADKALTTHSEVHDLARVPEEPHEIVKVEGQPAVTVRAEAPPEDKVRCWG